MDEFQKHFNSVYEKYEDFAGGDWELDPTAKVWYQRDGVPIKISDMTDLHLKNTIHLIFQCVRDYKKKSYFNNDFGKKNKRIEDVCPYYKDLIEEATKRKLFILDKHTYGNTPACLKMVELIEESDNPVKYSGKIGSTLCDFNSILKETSTIKDLKYKRYVIQLVHSDFKKKINELVIPDIFRSYLLNIIQTKLKVFRKDNNL